MENPDSIWKFSTVSLASVVLTLIGCYLTSQKNVVTKEDFNAYVTAQHEQNQAISSKVDAVDNRTRDLQSDMSAVKTQLGIDDGTMSGTARRRP